MKPLEQIYLEKYKDFIPEFYTKENLIKAVDEEFKPLVEEWLKQYLSQQMPSSDKEHWENELIKKLLQSLRGKE